MRDMRQLGITPRPRSLRLVHATTVPMTLRFLSGQVGFMRARGIEVIAMSSSGPDLDAFCTEEGIQGHAINMPRQITPGRDLYALGRIWHRLRALRPEIVHAHTPKCGLLVTIAAWLAHIPIRVYHIHGLPMLTATGTRRILLRCAERVACRLATQVLCVSHSVLDAAVAQRLCPAGKIKVLARGTINGIDSSGRFNPDNLAPGTRCRTRAAHGIPERALVVGFVGRIVRDKGVVELVGAWRTLRERFPSLHLLVVGPLEPQDPLPAECVQVLTTDSRIHLVGLDWNTPPLYVAMDLLVLPTYREGFPTVPLEAGALGLPIVATRVPGCTDAVVHGETGLLAGPRDVASLTELIANYLTDPERRRRHGQAAQRRVRREFKQEAIWEATWQEYTRLLTAAGRPGRPADVSPGVATECEVAPKLV